MHAGAISTRGRYWGVVGAVPVGPLMGVTQSREVVTSSHAEVCYLLKCCPVLGSKLGGHTENNISSNENIPILLQGRRIMLKYSPAISNTRVNLYESYTQEDPCIKGQAYNVEIIVLPLLFTSGKYMEIWSNLDLLIDTIEAENAYN